jgi:TonB family protein
MGCYFAMLGVTLFWLATLTRYAQKPGCLAWCLTFTFISFVLAIRLFLEQIKWTQYGLEQAQESRSLMETITAAYALASLAICVAFINTQWYMIDRTVLTQQTIEIELSPLPTNSQRIPLAKQPSHTVQKLPVAKSPPATTSAPALHPAVVKPSPVKPFIPSPMAPPIASKTNTLPAPVHNNAAQKTVGIVTPLRSIPLPPVSTRAVSRHTQRVSTGSSFFMEEVAPAQLVEVHETEKSAAPALRSPTTNPGEAVNVSVLAEYLRELHRIIKNAWTPPHDVTRSAEIIFRVKRSGELALIRVVKSSGDVDADESAINAITASAPFKPLPPAYSLGSLDIDYTFNYTSDKLTEVGSGYH